MDIAAFFGHLHPLIVHLPIGILIFAFLLAVVSHTERGLPLRPAVSLALLCGAISAAVACGAGYLLSLSGEYDGDLLTKHQWTGIAVAVVSYLAWVIERYSPAKSKWIEASVWLLTLGTLTLAGHYGGSLTHGTGYLTEGVFEKKKDKPKNTIDAINLPNLPQVAETLPADMPERFNNLNKKDSLLIKNKINTPQLNAPTAEQQTVKPVFVFKELIEPILNARCYNCHGPNKSKSDLRLDSPEFILKGGENGSILTAGNPDKSTLYTYLVLPQSDDMHMPPEGKPQLTTRQIELIHWWIQHGASFDKTLQDMSGGVAAPPSVGDATQPSKSPSKSVGTSVAAPPVMPAIKPAVPPKQVIGQAARPSDVEKIRQQNIIIASFGEQNNALTANFINVKNYKPTLLDDLMKLKQQVVRLKLSNQPVTDDDLKKIATFTNLTHLNLEKTRITDKGLNYLKNLPYLEQLNVYGTKVSEKGLQTLVSCPSLKTIYAWQTNVQPTQLAQLQNQLRGVVIDTGGVRFPPPDTTKTKN